MRIKSEVTKILGSPLEMRSEHPVVPVGVGPGPWLCALSHHASAVHGFLWLQGLSSPSDIHWWGWLLGRTDPALVIALSLGVLELV